MSHEAPLTSGFGAELSATIQVPKLTLYFTLVTYQLLNTILSRIETCATSGNSVFGESILLSFVNLLSTFCSDDKDTAFLTLEWLVT